MKNYLIILFVLSSFAVKAQKIDSIYFNLYTDSLKKGVHNYINVDGKMSSGIYQPLMSDEVVFSSTAGKWEGNSLILEKDTKIDSVIVTAYLKQQQNIKRSITIYLKKVEVDPILKTEQELLDEWQKKGKRKRD
ncbi:MAG TPA: hypothetical protein VF623_02045 [Segetibacter sp.]|jgi:hypothetical protein